MKIAVIGMGNVGRVLGRRWTEVGHQVVFGTRDVSRPEAVAFAKDARCELATPVEAAALAEVVVLAVPWPAAVSTVRSLGDLAGKILLDCTNPLLPDLSGLEVGTNHSGGEMIAAAAPGARVVKIFNSTGAANMANPRYENRGIAMLHSGDDARANEVAAGLARDLGFEPIDIGPLTASRILEPLALAWITLAYRRGLGPDFSLDVVRRGS